MKYLSYVVLITLVSNTNLVALSKRSVVPRTDWSVTPTVSYTQVAFSKGLNEGVPSLFLSGATVDYGLADAKGADVTGVFSTAPFYISESLKKTTQGYQLANLVLDVDGEATVLPLARESLKDLQVDRLALMNDQFPVIAVTDATGEKPQIMMMTSPGGTFITLKDTLNDAGSKPIIAPVVGLTTGKFNYVSAPVTSVDYIFAVVADPAVTKTPFFAGSPQVGQHRGVAIIQKTIVTAADVKAEDSSSSSSEAGPKLVLGQSQLKLLNAKQLRNSIPTTTPAVQIPLGFDDKVFAFTDSSDPNTPRQPTAPVVNSSSTTASTAVLGSNVQNGASIGDGVSLWWDNDLARLYIGLKSVSRDDNNKSMGIFGVGMGYIDTEIGGLPQAEFKLVPIVSKPNKSMFYDNTAQSAPAGRNILDRGVGFYFDGTSPKVTKNLTTTSPTGAANVGTANVQISVPFVRTMHTSTDKFYLIAQSNIGANGAGPENNIIALPLIPQGTSLAQKGTIAGVNKNGVPFFYPKETLGKQYKSPDSFSSMITTTMDSVSIGKKGPLDGGSVKDLFVAGDSVYVACGGTNVNYESKGIFASTALFNKDGFIIAWTPWARAMGDAVNVEGAGLDTNTGNFYMLTSADDDDSDKKDALNTGSVSVWGKGATFVKSDKTLTTPLSQVLATVFPQSSGGVYQIFTFDEFTPGFGSSPKSNGFTLLVAVGNSTVALIETAHHAGAQLQLIDDFKVDKNVFVYSNEALSKIAPLIGAEIQAQDQEVFTGGPSKIKILVYGCGGIAAMTLNTPIAAPTASTVLTTPSLDPQLAQISTVLNPTSASAPTFEAFFPAINQPVYSLVRSAAENPSGSNLIFTVSAVTDDGIYQLSYNGIDSKKISNTVAGSSLVSLVSSNFSTAILINGTDNGLAFSLPGILNGQNVPGQIMQLQYLSPGRVRIADVKDTSGIIDQSKTPMLGLDKQNGVLYAFTFAPRVAEDGDTSNPLNGKLCPQVYRLAVSNDTVSIIDKKRDGTPRPFIQYDDFRTNFATDGSTIFNISPRDAGMVDFVRATGIPEGIEGSAKMLSTQRSLQEILDLTDNDKHFHVGVIKRDPGSGSLMVPGDWGLRIND